MHDTTSTPHRDRAARADRQVVLVADADAAAARDLAGYLRERGFDAHATTRGEDALRLAAGGQLALAIVDAALEDMSGHALLARLRARDAAAPLLMTTADHNPGAEILARHLGVVAYVHKPADYRGLAAVAATAVRRAAAGR